MCHFMVLLSHGSTHRNHEHPGPSPVIPASIRRALDIQGPIELLFHYKNGRVFVETLDRAVADVQEIVAGYVPNGRSLVDELIAERRAEAALE